jgi:hypothetical protein
MQIYKYIICVSCEFIIEIFEISSNRTVNILLIIFKAVSDHEHDRSFDKN